MSCTRDLSSHIAEDVTKQQDSTFSERGYICFDCDLRVSALPLSGTVQDDDI